MGIGIASYSEFCLIDLLMRIQYNFKHDTLKESGPTCSVPGGIAETPETSNRNYCALKFYCINHIKSFKETTAVNATPVNRFD